MLTVDTASPDPASEPTCSERRLAANRENAQLSTGPRTEAGKAVSSLNAVKTGLTGQAVLFTDAEEARAYEAHLERVFARWQPKGDREHTLVQALADTQWRLNSIPGLESAFRALAQGRGATLLTHPDPAIARVLLQAQTEVAEAKALRNVRLQESRLLRRYERDEEELKKLQYKRFSLEEQQARLKRARQLQEEQERQRQEEEQRRHERAQKRAERKQAREAAQTAETQAQPVLLDAHGFEFSTGTEPDPTDLTTHHQSAEGNRFV
jgi:hypothetical protein